MNEHTDNLVPATPQGPTALCWIALVVVGVAFFLTEHNLFTSRMEMFGTTQDELEVNAVGGKLTNQVGFSLVALLGGVLLLRRGGQPWRLGGVLPLLICLLAAWCLASTMWSLNPMQTAKRWVILLFCAVGAMGLARQLTAHQVTWFCLIVTAGYAVVALGAEIALGTFRPHVLGYRFSGTMHPNGQGANCALLCLAAICLLKDAPRYRTLLVVLLAFGVVLMVLTRSRTAVAALVAGLAALACVNPSRQMVAGALGLAWLTAAASLVAMLCGFNLVEDLPRIVTLGRNQDITTLTGRTELWEELIPYVEERPLLGYGYGSFWNLDHIEAISGELYWDLSSAHSIYLEMTLGVGLIGAAGLVALLAVGLWRSIAQYRATKAWGDAFVLALLAYGIVDGISESGFTSPAFMTVVTNVGLCRLAFFAQGSEVGSQRAEVGSQRAEIRGQRSEVRGQRSEVTI